MKIILVVSCQIGEFISKYNDVLMCIKGSVFCIKLFPLFSAVCFVGSKDICTKQPVLTLVNHTQGVWTTYRNSCEYGLGTYFTIIQMFSVSSNFKAVDSTISIRILI